MKFCATPGAPGFKSDRLLNDRSALGAPDHLPKPRHVDVSGPVLRNPAGTGRRAWLLCGAR